MNTHPVIISNITLTKPTQKATGLKENDLAKLLAKDLTDKEKANLTLKVEFRQEREVVATQGGTGSGRRERMFGVAEVLAGHDKVNSGPRYKYDWLNAVNISYVEANGFVVGADLGALKQTTCYLLTEEYLTAEMRDNRIISSPKRKGKGGAVLTAQGKLIFQDTSLVSETSAPEFTGFTYSDFVAYEKSQAIAFDGEIPATDVPDESRENGFFNDEFEQWLTEKYTDANVGVLKEVA